MKEVAGEPEHPPREVTLLPGACPGRNLTWSYWIMVGNTAYLPGVAPITALLSVWPGPVGMVAARAVGRWGRAGRHLPPSPVEVSQLYSLARHSVAAVAS
jgi:hypothetical protein